MRPRPARIAACLLAAVLLAACSNSSGGSGLVPSSTTTSTSANSSPGTVTPTGTATKVSRVATWPAGVFTGIAAGPGGLYAAALNGPGPAATLLRANAARSSLTACRALTAAPTSMSAASSGLWLVGPASTATNANTITRYSTQCAPQSNVTLVGAVQVVATTTGAWVLQAPGSSPSDLTFIPVAGKARTITHVLPPVVAAAFDITSSGLAVTAGQLGDGSVVTVTVNTKTGAKSPQTILPKSGKPYVSAAPETFVGLQNAGTGGLVSIAGSQATVVDGLPTNSWVVGLASSPTTSWVLTATATPGDLGIQVVGGPSTTVTGTTDAPWLTADPTGAWLAAGHSLFRVST